MLVGLMALIVASAFAAAALYINFVEHPARMILPAQMAVRQWAPSYKRGFTMQATLAIVGGLSAISQWYLVGNLWWLAGGLLLLANWPFTLVVIMPTNRRLLASEGMSDGEIFALLDRWNRLHAVRTGLGIAAVATELMATLG